MSYFNSDRNTKSRGAGAIAAVDLGRGRNVLGDDHKVGQSWGKSGSRLVSTKTARYSVATPTKIPPRVVPTPPIGTRPSYSAGTFTGVQTKYTSPPIKSTVSVIVPVTPDSGSGSANTAGTFTGGSGGGGGGGGGSEGPGFKELTPDEIDELDPGPAKTSKKKVLIIGAVALAGLYLLLRKKKHS